MWKLVQIEITRGQEDLLGWLFIDELGAYSCQSLHSTDSTVHLQFGFAAEKLGDGLASAINEALSKYALRPQRMVIRSIDSKEWSEEWKKGYKPLAMGGRLLVRPPWCHAPSTRMRPPIYIQPKLGFGNGHVTTHLCLEFMEEIASGPRILDIGTGSGVLSIGSALIMPDCQVTAIEIDPAVCEVARENFQINNVADRIVLLEGSIFQLDPGIEFDTIFCNLSCPVNCDLASTYEDRLNPGGHVIMGGILNEDLHKLEESMAKTNLQILEKRERDAWTCVVARRN